MKLNWKSPLVLMVLAAALVWAASKYAGEKSAKVFTSPMALALGSFLVIGGLWKGGMFEKLKDVKSVTQ